uniref:hypothetical protein n=1 Tax=Pantoea ananas TaxID=553 RepID=UPI001B313003
TRIAASACQFKQDDGMDFLKAVLLAILIHILAPLVVHYVETNLTISSAYEAQNGRGETGDVRRLNW